MFRKATISKIELGINIIHLPLTVSHPPRDNNPSPDSLSLQLGLNSTLDRSRLGGAGPAALDLAVLADEELLKVPLDALQAHEPGLLLLHPLPHGLRAVAVDLGLAEHLVGDLVAEDAEVLDFLVGARVLAAELVAGEGEDFKVFVVGSEVWMEGVSGMRSTYG